MASLFLKVMICLLCIIDKSKVTHHGEVVKLVTMLIVDAGAPLTTNSLKF